ncbi:YigZ family protein [Porphyromonas sp. oral taxon 275]|uniref:IMPACT family protein n=1 Tax=Porphyromonas sp. oral taxon 275 TaxID=712435 RepID=UPI00201193FE|nr:YigZ family protein [Porphyromonas sp. oral taxon 275]
MSEELIEIKDSYWTIAGESEGNYSEKRSKFLAFAYHVTTEEEALAHVATIRGLYYDARHVCWAYRLGPDGGTTRANDDGEPSGTAGKPILGIITSLGLTEIIVLVVRYFGGVKLGTSGLIEAYREATLAALEPAERKECILTEEIELHFSYELMGLVMRHVKELEAEVKAQDFRESCILRLQLRQAKIPELEQRLGAIYGLTIKQSSKD